MIGVFDSGVGGMTLLHELIKLMPHEDYIYFADVDHVPYSHQSPENILQFVDQAVQYLIQRGCKVIVLACNTATNVAVELLREKYELPIVAIQPAVKVAADHSEDDKRILTCATPVTLKSTRYQNLVRSLNIEHRLDNLPLPGLVEFAERGVFDGLEVEAYLQQHIGSLNTPEHHFIVLGCTHFTFFEPVIERLFPNLEAIDGNYGTAKQVKRVLEEQTQLKSVGSGYVSFVESGRPAASVQKYIGLLKKIRSLA